MLAPRAAGYARWFYRSICCALRALGMPGTAARCRHYSGAVVCVRTAHPGSGTLLKLPPGHIRSWYTVMMLFFYFAFAPRGFVLPAGAPRSPAMLLRARHTTSFYSTHTLHRRAAPPVMYTAAASAPVFCCLLRTSTRRF
jgi:hypothetical protein